MSEEGSQAAWWEQEGKEQQAPEQVRAAGVPEDGVAPQAPRGCLLPAPEPQLSTPAPSCSLEAAPSVVSWTKGPGVLSVLPDTGETALRRAQDTGQRAQGTAGTLPSLSRVLLCEAGVRPDFSGTLLCLSRPEKKVRRRQDSGCPVVPLRLRPGLPQRPQCRGGGELKDTPQPAWGSDCSRGRRARSFQPLAPP